MGLHAHLSETKPIQCNKLLDIKKMKNLLFTTLLICTFAIFAGGCKKVNSIQEKEVKKEQKRKRVVFDDKVLSLPTKKRDALYTSSCANHFIQLKMALIMSNKFKPDLILPSTANTVKALKRIFIESGFNEKGEAEWVEKEYCTESYYTNTGFGYIYIGDGLKLKDVVNQNILILFCQGENHRGTSEHCHGWKLSNGGMCAKTNQEMLKELKKALKRGETGEVAYSPRAMAVLKEEIKKREK